jgi:ribosome maturation factor RimP
MTKPIEQIQKVMEILTKWNPLGSRANTVSDLDNYKTEAIDILFNLDLTKNNPAAVVQQVINQAFDLSLSVADCASVGRKIQKLLKERNRF